jgi:cytoskeletal protein CcmA (bactofilin family)
MGKTIMSVFNNQNGRAGEARASSTAAGAESAVPASASAPGNAQRTVMILGKTLRFKGELSADEDLVLLGQIQGSINHTASLTVGFGGVVIGNVRARVITVKGTVEGDLEASDSIVVSPSANVVGDLVAPRVSVVDGATFNGAVRMPRPVAADSAKTSASPSATPAGEGILGDKNVDKLLGAS